MESCNGFADLENQKSPKHVQNTLKPIYIAYETKKKFSIFFAHTLYMESCNGFADLENQKSSKHVQNHFKIIFRT